MKPRFDFDFSDADYFTALHTTACRRSAPVTFRRFTCTRTGVVNPAPSTWASAVSAALRHARVQLAALFPGRPKGGLR